MYLNEFGVLLHCEVINLNTFSIIHVIILIYTVLD
mgnify:FL=1|jgi:hypothetical protein